MIAVTMPGKFGDLIWSLATTKEIANQHGPVDFYTMIDYGSIVDLLNTQSYINKALALEDWKMESDCPGAQPHIPPNIPEGYERVIHLGYPYWPPEPLINFSASIAKEQGINVTFSNPLPFLEAESIGEYDLAIGFTGWYLHPAYQDGFLKPFLERAPDISYVTVHDKPWVEAAGLIAGSKLFIGNRSSNHVLAYGLNKFVLDAESNNGARADIFGCPYGQSFIAPCADVLYENVSIAHRYADAMLEYLHANTPTN